MHQSRKATWLSRLGLRSPIKLDLQAKITLVLLAVILPTFIIVTLAQNKLTQPILEEELKQLGINSAKALAAEIVSSRKLSLPDPGPKIESSIQEIVYAQPSIIQLDVLGRDPSGAIKVIASNIEDETGVLPVASLQEFITAELKNNESGDKVWEISVPIEQKRADPKAPRKLLGNVHVIVTLKLVKGIAGALWRTTATAAAFSVVMLILLLGYFLRKTIENDRRLKAAESQNLRLAAQLHDTERQLMVSEKLAAMGQLTASFAHEIGTPLNAIGGHLQLLNEDLSAVEQSSIAGRLEIVNGQLAKIEEIIRTFLHNTAKPPSQTQLIDVNAIIDRALGIVHPQVETLGIELKRDQERSMGPLRIVPIDLEQILLNLLNNSIDSLREKAKAPSALLRPKLLLEVQTRTVLTEEDGMEWAEFVVHDTGEGISRADLKNVLRPFFTTKRPGEGTGLGLTICQELAHKYGGMMNIDSKKGAWARVTVRIPYRTVS